MPQNLLWQHCLRRTGTQASHRPHGKHSDKAIERKRLEYKIYQNKAERNKPEKIFSSFFRGKYEDENVK